MSDVINLDQARQKRKPAKALKVVDAQQYRIDQARLKELERFYEEVRTELHTRHALPSDIVEHIRSHVRFLEIGDC
jgi:hypothetical protein